MHNIIGKMLINENFIEKNNGFTNLQINNATVSSKICPATILANNRRAKLTDRKTKLINSINAKKGTNANGIPDTKNSEINARPLS